MNGTAKAIVAVFILTAFAGLVAVLVTVYMPRTAAPIAERGYQLPTATETFQLRSACADLGQKLLEDHVVGLAVNRDQVSYYNSRTNRCYVELTTSTIDNQFYVHRSLYDGQTREMLAFVRNEQGILGGMVFDKQHIRKSSENGGFDDASEYIDAMMADDRK